MKFINQPITSDGIAVCERLDVIVRLLVAVNNAVHSDGMLNRDLPPRLYPGRRYSPDKPPVDP